jgi:hypothetical protein
MSTRKGKGAVIMLLLAAMILLITGQALAQHGSATAGSGSFFDSVVNPNASGTKVAGTLTVYYERTGQTCASGAGEVTNFVYLFRLITANAKNTAASGVSLPFSGRTPGVCFTDTETQKGIVTDFITGTVLPQLFTSYGGWDIKSVTDVVEPSSLHDPCCLNGTEFMMMDLTLAVH